MANWITHTRIADELLKHGFDFDACSFCIGNIAPDCNVENEDWTAFVPSRNETHYMTSSNKMSADYEAFFREHLSEHLKDIKRRSFLYGYAVHLMTDAAYQRFVRDKARVSASFERIKRMTELAEQIKGMPENFDTLKRVFGKQRAFHDVVHQEEKYVLAHPECSYNTIVRKTTAFPDYLDMFPKGAIVRKIEKMAYEVTESANTEETLVFFSEDEVEAFVQETVLWIKKELTKRIEDELSKNH